MITLVMVEADHSLDTLLLLDGETFVIEGAFWVKRRRHPERSRFSGGAKDLPLDRPGA